MKQLLLLNIMLAALFAPAHAATIQAYASEMNTADPTNPDYDPTYGTFFSSTAGDDAISNADIQRIITSNTDTALSGSIPSDYLFGYSSTDYSVIDLNFGDTTVKTGSGGDSLGADLAIVSLWSGSNYQFGLEAFDTTGNSLSFFLYDVTNNTPETCDSTNTCFGNVKTTSINLYGTADRRELGDDIELGYIRLFIGGKDLNNADGLPDGYSNFSLAGAYYTDATVVPLPLSAVLFSSGLLLLGWVGRRKTI